MSPATNGASAAPAARHPICAVLLDMGGVLLEMQNESGLPEGDADAAGRVELLALLCDRGARVEESDLDRLLFTPWRIEYARRYELQREADWRPHVERLISVTGAEVSPDEVLAAWFRPYGEGLRPIDGAAATLRELRVRGFSLGLISNVALPGALYRERLAAHDLAEPFTAMRFSGDAGSRKPAPEMLLSALADLGTSPAKGVMVGDRKKSDIAAGRAAGVRTIWLRSHHVEGPEPDATIDALVGLPAALEAL